MPPVFVVAAKVFLSATIQRKRRATQSVFAQSCPGLLRAAQLCASAGREADRSTAAAAGGDAGRKSESSERAGAGRAGFATAGTAAARRPRRYG